MKKFILAVTLALTLVFPAFFVVAQEEVLEIDPGLTPTSPLYFFDKVGEWAHLNIFTLNAVKKVELKARFAEERLAELKLVVETDPKEAFIEELKERLAKRLEEINNNVEQFDKEGRDVAHLVEKLNELSLRHQGVIERVLESAPTEAQEALRHVLEVSRRGHRIAEEVLLRQKEKGHILQERAEEILERNLRRLGRHASSTLERIEALPEGDALREHLKELLEEKLEHLENRLIDVESKDDLQNFREEFREESRDTARNILEIRQRIQRHATITEGILREIKEGEEFNKEEFAVRAEQVIREAGEAIQRAIKLLEEVKARGLLIPQSVEEHLRIATSHSLDAKEAFTNEDFGKAFGLANAAKRNAEAAINLLKRLQDGNETEGAEAEKRPEVCIEVFKPVCGRDGKMYGNECKARRAGVQILYEGECRQNRREGDNSSVESELKQNATVEVTENGFAPRIVTVRKGGTITWINKTSRNVWPASALHPTHRFYPEFDAQAGVAPEAVYAFTFDKLGSWKYHDHLQPSFTGTVVVEE